MRSSAGVGPADGGVQDEYLRMVGARVRKRRSEKRLSRRALSQLSGVSERFLAHLELGEGNISIRRLKSIADALGVPVAEILADRRASHSDENERSGWRTQPNAIAELFRHADPSRQQEIVEILVGTAYRRRAA